MSAKSLPRHFNHCPSCGSKSVSLADEKRLDCASCNFVLYFNPTCSAAALIFDKSGRLLVVERAREPSKGKYGVPGGFTDFGESLEEVVVREAKEETNLNLTSASFFASFPNSYHYKNVTYAVTDTYFKSTVDSFEDVKLERSEIKSIQFVDITTVPSEKWAFPSLRNAIAKLLEEA